MRTRTLLTIGVFSSFVLAGVVLACGGEDRLGPAPNPPPLTAASTPASPTTATAATTTTTAPSTTATAPASGVASVQPVGPILFTDPTTFKKMYDAAIAAPQVTLDAKGPVGTDAVSKGIQDLAKKYAADMKPEGPMGRGKLTEGSHLQMAITLAGGKCYRIIGYSPDKPNKQIADLDLLLLLPPGVPNGQDTTDDNTPVIDRTAPICPALPITVSYTLDIFAEHGAGDVGVQLYSRAK